MSDQDNLRDRIAEVISSATTGWVREEYVTDLSEGDYIAQAIIDEFGLEMERRVIEGFAPSGHIDQKRFVSKWEKA